MFFTNFVSGVGGDTPSQCLVLPEEEVCGSLVSGEGVAHNAQRRV